MLSEELNATTNNEEVTKTAGGQVSVKAFTAEGAALRAQMSDEAKQVEGSKSDKVAFVRALWNPAKPQSYVDGGETKKGYVVVGYKFRALEDIEVPVCPISSPKDLYVNTSTGDKVHVAAGEEFVLDIMETGKLISQPEFAGRFSGGDNPVVLRAAASKKRGSCIPTLGLANKDAGSIKDGAETIAIMEGADGEHRGTPKVKDEYAEKFGKLFVRTASAKRAGMKKHSSEKDLAAAFNAFLNN
jgi:hypothetical protein